MVVWRGYECVLVDFLNVLNQQFCTLHLSSLVMRVLPIAFCGWTDWVSKSQCLPAVNSWICCKSAMLKRHPIRSENQRRKEHRYRCGASLLHQHDDFSKQRIFGFQPAALVQQANEQTEMISTASPRRRKAETAELGSAGVKAVYPGGKNQNKQTKKQKQKKNWEQKAETHSQT